MDQADRLRNMVSNNAPEKPMSSRVITVTSGKGGVGKTNFAVNLGLYLSSLDLKVAIIDADFGLANIEVLLGMIPKYNLQDVLNREKTMAEIVAEGPGDVKFISGGSGLRNLANMTDAQMNYVMESFSYLDEIADVILIDTGAGINKSVLQFIQASGETIIVATPDPTSITDAYALIKTVKEETESMPEIKMVVNRADSAKEGEEVYEKINRVSEKFLSVSVDFLGTLQYDKDLVKAVKEQEPVMLAYPNSVYVRNLKKIGNKLTDTPMSETDEPKGVLSFVEKFVGLFGN